METFKCHSSFFHRMQEIKDNFLDTTKKIRFLHLRKDKRSIKNTRIFLFEKKNIDM